MKGKRTGRVLLLTLALASLGLASCEEGGASSSSPSPAESADEILWSFEAETYVPDLNPDGNFLDYIGLPWGPTSLVYYQGYDDINDGTPYVRREGMGSPDAPRSVYELYLEEEKDYLAYYLPSGTEEGLDSFLEDKYQSDRMALFGKEEDDLVDGRYIYAAAANGLSGSLRMQSFAEFEDVRLGDDDYRLVGLFERRELHYVYDIQNSKEIDETFFLLARLILDGERNPVLSLHDLYPDIENEDVDLYRAAGSYHVEREMFDANVGYGFSFMAQAKDGYLQAPGLTFYQPFYKRRSFKKIYELPAGPLIREIRYVDGIDILAEALPADASPDEVDPFGDALRPLFKEAWLFDVEGSSYAYFDWGKLRLSLGEARREHLSTIQSAGSL